MNRRMGRVWRWLILIAACGTMFQTTAVGFTRTGLGGSCQLGNFLSNGALTSVDFCYLLDCQNGFLGGAIQPCGSNTTTADDLLVDCNTLNTVGTNTTTTNTNTTGN